MIVARVKEKLVVVGVLSVIWGKPGRGWWVLMPSPSAALEHCHLRVQMLGL